MPDHGVGDRQHDERRPQPRAGAPPAQAHEAGACVRQPGAVHPSKSNGGVRCPRDRRINSEQPRLRAWPGDPGRLGDPGPEAEIPFRPTEKGKLEAMATHTAEPAAGGAAAVEHLTLGGPRLAAARDAADARVGRARDDPVPPGQGPRVVLRRLRTGGGVGRRRVRDGPGGPPVHPAPRPGGAPDPRRDADADPVAVHGPRRRHHSADATATCTSATATSAASGWSRCSPT